MINICLDKTRVIKIKECQKNVKEVSTLVKCQRIVCYLH